jgi:ABC-type transport system substrate-binding protein
MCYDDCETPILKDTKFRLGMNLAIDRESIVNDLYRGVAMVPNGFTLKGDFGYDPSLPPMEYNPEKAKELIEESGYQGETIAMFTTASDYVPNDKALAETVVAMLQAVGVNTDLSVFDTAERGDMIRNKRCPGLFIGNPSSAMFDPASHFWRQLRPGGYYDHGYSVTNKVFFDSMTAAESEIDPDKRAELYQKANQALLEDPPWLMVLQQVHTYGVGPKIANWHARSDHRIQFLDLRLAE